MALWSLAVLLGLLSLAYAARSAAEAVPSRVGGEKDLRAAAGLLHELQETLEAGLVPEPARWDSVGALTPPWGPLAQESLRELRARGGALLPTLRRLRRLADDQLTALKLARSRAAQALAQAAGCALVAPVFAAVLYVLLPGLDERPLAWIAASAGAVVLSGAGALWLLAMAESARWGGLGGTKREWMLASLCAGERFLALVRAGTPPDLAWTRTVDGLDARDADLAALWGRTVWVEALPAPVGPAAAIAAAAQALRKGIQVSLLEGRPCLERAEATLEALRRDHAAQVERELSLLGTRALQPLFLCVAPSLLGLLAFGVALAWEGMAA
jgi:hypothetical protein